MTRQEFHEALESGAQDAPAELTPEQQVLFYTEAGQWDRAHDIASEIPGQNGAWLHAHLHRIEGDLGNAAYWYDRAGRATPPASLSLQSERQNLIAHFITE